MVKKVLKKVLISAVSVIIALTVIELLLRWTHLFGARISWTQPDNNIGYRYTPNAVYWNNNENNRPISGRINKYGWRDTDWEVTKPADQCRIAVLGDSYIEAFQVEEDSTFLAIVERELSGSQEGRYELMNFGRSGFTQSEEYLVLKNDVLAFNPDMVLLFFLPDNDIREIIPELAVDKTRPFFGYGPDGGLKLDTSYVHTRTFQVKKKINPFKQHSAFISLMAERYNALTRRSRREEVRQEVWERREDTRYRIPDFLNLASSNPDPQYQKAYDLNKRLIREMADLCKSRSIDFTLVLIGSRHSMYDNIIGYRKVDPDFDPFWFERDLEKFSGEIGVDFIDLRTVFVDKVRKGAEDLFWSHWSYQGHRLTAEIIKKYLSAQQMNWLKDN